MKRLFFALILAITAHAALLSIKINTFVKSESQLKSEPIKITMSYRQIKKEIKPIQPEIAKPIQPEIIKPSPLANKKFKPVKKKTGG